MRCSLGNMPHPTCKPALVVLGVLRSSEFKLKDTFVMLQKNGDLIKVVYIKLNPRFNFYIFVFQLKFLTV